MNRFLEFIRDKEYNIVDNSEYLSIYNKIAKAEDEFNKSKARMKIYENELNKGGFIYKLFNRIFNRKHIEELEKNLEKEKSIFNDLDLKYTQLLNESYDIPEKIDKVEEFAEELKNTSPDYDMLMEMYEFIHCASIIWFYNNSEESEIYNLPETTNGRKSHARIFVVKDLNGLYTITVRLLGTGVVELNTKNNKSSDSYTYHFKNNDWDMEYDIADEMGVEYAQSIIMNAFVKAFMYCYNLK